MPGGTECTQRQAALVADRARLVVVSAAAITTRRRVGRWLQQQAAAPQHGGVSSERLAQGSGVRATQQPSCTQRVRVRAPSWRPRHQRVRARTPSRQAAAPPPAPPAPRPQPAGRRRCRWAAWTPRQRSGAPGQWLRQAPPGSARSAWQRRAPAARPLPPAGWSLRRRPLPPAPCQTMRPQQPATCLQVSRHHGMSVSRRKGCGGQAALRIDDAMQTRPSQKADRAHLSAGRRFHMDCQAALPGAEA